MFKKSKKRLNKRSGSSLTNKPRKPAKTAVRGDTADLEAIAVMIAPLSQVLEDSSRSGRYLLAGWAVNGGSITYTVHGNGFLRGEYGYAAVALLKELVKDLDNDEELSGGDLQTRLAAAIEAIETEGA